MPLTDYIPRKLISVGSDLIISTIFGKSPDQIFEVKEIADYKSDYDFKLQNGKKCDGYTHGENEPTLGRPSDHLLFR